MEELGLRELLFSFYRQRKLLLISFIILFSITFGLQKISSPKEKKIFSSTASVRVSQLIHVPYMVKEIGIDIKTLKFDPDEEKVKIKSEENIKTALSILGWDVNEENINKVRNMIEVSVKSRENIIDITAYSENPSEAKDVANAVANAYVQNSKKWFEQSIENAISFLKESSDELSQKLKEMYNALSQFSAQTGIIDPASQLDQNLRKMIDLRKNISLIDMKIQAIENFFLKISRNPSKTAEHLRNLDEILLKDSLPEEKEAVSELKNKVGRIISIDESLISSYTKYFELEKVRKELLAKYSEEHPKIKELDREIQKIFEDILYRLKLLLAKLKLEKQAAEKEIENLRKDMQYITGNLSEYMYLSNSIELLNKVFENYYNNLIELKIASGMWSQFAEVYKSAPLPTEPIKRLKFQLVLSLLVALVGSVVVVFIAESLDSRFKNVEEILRYLKIPVFGMIPKFKVEGHNTKEEFIIENVKMIRNMLRIIYGDKLKILVTSCEDGEGKTFLSFLLSRAFGSAGLKTAIIDLNLRHPSLSEIFNLPKEKSFTKLILSDADLLSNGLERLIELSEFKVDDNLSLFGAKEEEGEVLNFKLDIFFQNIFPRLLEKLSKKFDVVIADSPPALIVSDIFPIISSFDVILVVYDMGKVGRKRLNLLLDMLKTGGARDIKLVVNKVTREFAPDLIPKSYYYYYYYRSGKKGKK
jgi:succinoglycan biosynthesis transport protein ExoP